MSKASNVKAYPKEFREKVVQLVQGGDRSQREVAEEFGISTDSVRRWVQQAERDQGSRQDGLRTSEREELSRLRRENRQLKMDREILSKAAAWFARETNCGVRIRKSESGSVSDRPHVPFAGGLHQRVLRVAGAVAESAGAAEQGLSRRIAAIHAESRQIYGARRVWAELRAQGVTVSRRRVARLMRALGLQGVTRRKRRCTTRRDAQAAVAPDRVQRRFEAAEPNRLWVADITYVPTLEGFVYLATVLDVFSRKVVGWAMSARQTVALVQSALGMAVTARAAQGVVLHSDRGSQYTALVFTRQCAAAGIERSMGSAGDCFDNAMAESLFATVECELLQRVEFATRAEAELEIFRFVEGFYNRKRRHSGLGYLSPVEFEQAWHTQQAAA